MANSSFQNRSKALNLRRRAAILNLSKYGSFNSHDLSPIISKEQLQNYISPKSKHFSC